MDWNVWGPPLVVLLTSVVFGGFIAAQSKSSEVKEEKARTVEEELLAKKEQVMEALRELESDRAKLSASEYERQREELLLQAEDVLRKMEEGEATETAQRPSSLSNTQIWGYVVGTAVFFIVLVGLLQEYARPRQAGDVMTGGTSSGAPSAVVEMAEARQTRQDEAKAALKKDPNDSSALNLLTYDALIYQQMTEAMSYMEQARQINPSDPDFLVNLSVLQMSVQMYERAAVGLSQALAQKPDMPRALLWKAMMLAQMRQPEQALESLNKTVGKLTLLEEQYLSDQLRTDLDKPPPILSGVLLAENAPATGTLFVIARRGLNAKGPPVAVKKISRPSFPMSFDLGKGDMVMGGVWPEEVWLEARLDMDGDAMTKSEQDWTAEPVGPLRAETAGISLVLSGAFVPDTKEVASDVRLTGQVDASGAPSGTLFVIARRGLNAKGPPVAVKKIAQPAFPVTFQLSDADMMLGGVWPKEVWLEARLDIDGDAMTKSEQDWNSEKMGPLTSGSQALSVVLHPKQ